MSMTGFPKWLQIYPCERSGHKGCVPWLKMSACCAARLRSMAASVHAGGVTSRPCLDIAIITHPASRLSPLENRHKSPQIDAKLLPQSIQGYKHTFNPYRGVYAACSGLLSDFRTFVAFLGTFRIQ